MSLVVDEHRQFLSDAARLSAFDRAIREVVQPGSVVLDLGSGTGILGLMACRAGARRVYSIEASGMAEIARAAARENGVADRMTVLHGLSSELTLPEPVDAIVCDQIGRFGVEAGIVAYGGDARRRFLRERGSMLPARVDLVLAPVEAPQSFADVQFWTAQHAGFNFSAAREWAANTGYPTRLSPEALLARPRVAGSIEMLSMPEGPLRLACEFDVERGGALHGLGGWFSASLSPSVTMTNAPGASDRIDRRNVFFPIDRAVSVQPGDSVAVRMHVLPPDMMAWTVDLRRGTMRLGQFVHSTLNGMLVCADDLRRTGPRFAPRLTPRGEARRSVLALCDGLRPIADIERQVYASHGDLFASLSEAQVFVAEVVTRYSQPPSV